MLNIVVLVSGGGTNLQALIDAQKRGEFKDACISTVISSREGVYALERAQQAGIEGRVVARRGCGSGEEYSRALLAALEECRAGLVVLAGFLQILSPEITRAYAGRIINVHPSLIPSFCGDGCYGLHVHEAVLKYGVKVTGATVHFVNEVTDGGAIILQKAVPVLEGDTPEALQRRVMEQAEWELLPQAVALFCEGRLVLEDGRVRIK
ncbi:MAG: phosphoribosylglycinamide formyltransferase [Clostridia bacterium]|nr:phosphoribosylglycinamide formyltransferase [Clostridia bacterium]MDR3643563.1 phosphoribosylglycinamide formyltransferase [Clostridia bacterium]